MEALQQLQISYSTVAAAAAILAVLFKIFGHLIRALEWRDKYFIHKRLVRLKAIRSSATTNSALARYVEVSIELEVFRIASGINTSQAKMEYLLQLNLLGRWGREQLKSLSKFLYIEPGSTTPQLSVTAFDLLGAWISGFAAFSVLILSVLQMVRFAIAEQSFMWLIGLMIFAIGILVGRFLATDLIDYLIVLRARKHLELTVDSGT